MSSPAPQRGQIAAVCTSEVKGTTKRAVEEVTLLRGHGIQGDAHAGSGHRQVSLLAEEEIDRLRTPELPLPAGAFGENLVTRGLDLRSLQVGQRLLAGRAVLQLTQRGKTCHSRCPIYFQTGDCIMPREGLFARVRRDGVLRAGDAIGVDPELDSLRFAVLTLSDRGAAGQRTDSSGDLAAELLTTSLGGRLAARGLLPDEQPAIERELCRLADEEVCDLVVTTGGTGLSPRDLTPEATLAVIDRQVPGMAEAMRAAGMRSTPRAMLSRGVCGLRGPTLIVNLSGSPRAVREQLEAILPALPHALEIASGIPQDCGATRPAGEQAR